jgi:hypothetical protein
VLCVCNDIVHVVLGIGRTDDSLNCEKQFRRRIIGVHDQQFAMFTASGECSCDRQLRITVIFERTMSLYVLRRKIGENERIHVDEALAVLACTLAGHLDDRMRTACSHCVAQKTLDEESSGHRHLLHITCILICDLDMQCSEDSSLCCI